MKRKDKLVSELEIPENSLTRRWLEKVIIGVMDKKDWPEEKNEYRCAKKLYEEVPKNILPGCGFKNSGTSAEKIIEICRGMKDVLEWAYEGCHVQGNGNARAVRTMQKLNQLCGNMKKKYEPSPKPVPKPGTCPFDGKNKICDESDKCGLSYFSSCVQLEVK